MEAEAYQELIGQVLAGEDYLAWDLEAEAESQEDAWGLLVAKAAGNPDSSAWEEMVALLSQEELPQTPIKMLADLEPLMENWPAEIRKMPAAWWNPSQKDPSEFRYQGWAQCLEMLSRIGVDYRIYYHPQPGGELALSRLKILRVYQGFLSDLELPSITDLEELVVLDRVDFEYTMPGRLNYLASMPALRILSHVLYGGTDLKPIAQLEKLVELHLTFVAGTAQLSPLKDLTGLKTLTLTAKKAEVCGLIHLAEVAGLEELSLTHINPEHHLKNTPLTSLSLSDLECPAQDFLPHTLKRLHLSQIKGMADLAALSSMKALSELWISHADGLASLKGIRPDAPLKTMRITACPGLKDLEYLLTLPNLERVAISQWEDAPYLAELAEKVQFKLIY